MPVDERPTCSFCRQNRADGFLHDDPTANSERVGDYWTICFDCIERLIERENALAESPQLSWMLPDIWDRPPRPLRRPQGRLWTDNKDLTS